MAGGVLFLRRYRAASAESLMRGDTGGAEREDGGRGDSWLRGDTRGPSATGEVDVRASAGEVGVILVGVVLVGEGRGSRPRSFRAFSRAADSASAIAVACLLTMSSMERIATFLAGEVGRVGGNDGEVVGEGDCRDGGDMCGRGTGGVAGVILEWLVVFMGDWACWIDKIGRPKVGNGWVGSGGTLSFPFVDVPFPEYEVEAVVDVFVRLFLRSRRYLHTSEFFPPSSSSSSVSLARWTDFLDRLEMTLAAVGRGSRKSSSGSRTLTKESITLDDLSPKKFSRFKWRLVVPYLDALDVVVSAWVFSVSTFPSSLSSVFVFPPLQPMSESVQSSWRLGLPTMRLPLLHRG